MPPQTGRYAWAVEDGEAGDDNGIGDAGGINFDDESYLGYSVPGGIVDAEGPDDNGIADSGGEQEVIARSSRARATGWTASAGRSKRAGFMSARCRRLVSSPSGPDCPAPSPSAAGFPS